MNSLTNVSLYYNIIYDPVNQSYNGGFTIKYIFRERRVVTTQLNIYIDDINRNITYENDSIFSCLNHKNSTVLVVNSLSPLIINSLKDNSVV